MSRVEVPSSSARRRVVRAALATAALLVSGLATGVVAHAETDPSVRLDADVVAAGQPLTLRAEGLDPYDTVAVALDADGLVTLRADADGTLLAPVPLPAATAEGRYELTVTAAGLPAAVTMPVTVASAEVAAAFGPLPAVPPEGPGANTPGTSSTVSPATVAHGETLSFTVAGYPAGETLYVKIDDGAYQGSAVVQGADIVATFPVSGDGTVAGQLTVPDDLEVGEHTLRFLATEVIDQGTLGYTHGSDPFTVTAASGGDEGGAGGGDGGAGGGEAGDAGGSGDDGGTGGSEGSGGDDAGTGGTGGKDENGSGNLAQTGPAGLATAALAGLAALALGAAAVRSARTRRSSAGPR